MKAEFDYDCGNLVLVFHPENATERMALQTWGKSFGIEPGWSGRPGFIMHDHALQAVRQASLERARATTSSEERPTEPEPA